MKHYGRENARVKSKREREKEREREKRRETNRKAEKAFGWRSGKMAVLLNRSLLRPSRVGVGPGAAAPSLRWNEKRQQAKRERDDKTQLQRVTKSHGELHASFHLDCRRLRKERPALLRNVA